MQKPLSYQAGFMSAIIKFLDPKNDVAFRKIFGSEKNKDILIHFLNDMIDFTGGFPIEKVTILKTIMDPDIAAKKTSIVDILCEDEKGTKYIVEMQVAQAKGFEKRAQYYASKAYSSQANVGDQYDSLKEVIFLAIANYVMFPNKQDYKSDHVILDKKTKEWDLKDFSFTFVELPKFTKDIDSLETIQEKWCYFFKHAAETSPEELKKILENDGILEKAYQELDQFYWTKEELSAYEQAEKARKDYIASLQYKYDEGIAKGRAEGKEEGRNEAMIETAKKLLEQKVPLLIIKAATGLSEEQISEIKSYNRGPL